MPANANFNRDLLKTALTYMTRPALVVVGFAVVLTMAYCKGRGDGKASVKVAAAVEAVKVADVARAVAAETVYVAAKTTAAAVKAKARTDTLVKIISDTVLSVRLTPSAPESLFVVPAPVVARIRADSVVIVAQAGEIRSLYTLVRADSQAIAARDKLIRELKPARCGMKCGVVLGAVGAVLTVKAIQR